MWAYHWKQYINQHNWEYDLTAGILIYISSGISKVISLGQSYACLKIMGKYQLFSKNV